MKKLVSMVAPDDSGQNLADFGLLLLLVNVALVTMATYYANQLTAVFNLARGAMK
ncbi:MAG TPA: hypothetical protein VFI72_04205 [Candidatus Angelobacter sp.]|nr:hypothetical protein [Candidatus Angelobacter sp.]